MGCSQPTWDGQCLHQDLMGMAPLLSWSRSWSTGCSKEQHCTACGIHTFPQSSLLNVPQRVCGSLAARIRTQGQRGVFTLSRSPDPHPGAGRSQPLVAEQSTCTTSP